MKTLPKKLIYVAGPFRAPTRELINKNIQRAAANAFKVWKTGHYALCPHTVTCFDNFPASERAWLDSSPDSLWLDGTMEMMRRCDAVFLGEGWEMSSGSKAEKAEAERLGIPVFTDWSKFEQWLASPAKRKERETITA